MSQTFRPMFPSPPRPAPAGVAPDAAQVRQLCMELLADSPAWDRKSMLMRLQRLRRADDLWLLRSALFEVIALNLGEATARLRLADFDSRLHG